MTWKVVFHPLVLSEDFRRIDSSDRIRIFKAIRGKLSAEPERYGEPLRRGLFGYWKLRVGAIRVIYRIAKSTVTVLILKIGFRRDSEVYAGMVLRLRRME